MSKNNKSYIENSHTIGRLGQLISMIIMLGIPIVICMVYDVWPTDWKQFTINCIGLISVFGVVNVASVISYTPVLGTAFYISCITGNVQNLKLPCALNAIDIANVPLGTEESDVAASLSVAVSSLLTMAIMVVGMLLLIPLQPFMTSALMKTATANMLPALFGSMLLGVILNNKSGKFLIKGQPKLVVIPMAIVVAIHYFVMPVFGKEGILMLLAIPMLMLCAKFFVAKGIITLEPIAKAKIEQK